MKEDLYFAMVADGYPSFTATKMLPCPTGATEVKPSQFLGRSRALGAGDAFAISFCSPLRILISLQLGILPGGFNVFPGEFFFVSRVEVGWEHG